MLLNLFLRETTDDEYFKVLKSIVDVGKKQKKNVSRFEFRLSQRARPARDLAHVVTIAYFEQRGELQQKYPNAYICCSSSNNEIEVLMGDTQLPANEIVSVDEYQVKIHFLGDKVSKLRHIQSPKHPNSMLH